jgi:lysophospholipase L1-like esterase
MKILTVGDSFTFGEELTDRNQAWPFLLAAQLNATVTNMARPGSGNKRMVRYVMEHIAEGHNPDLVVIGWSSAGRMEFADEDGFFDVWPGYSGRMFANEQPWRLDLLDYINRHHNEEYLYRQYVLDVILLQNFLTCQGIKYIMIRAVGNEYYHNTYHKLTKLLNDLVDDRYYLGWPGQGMAEWTQGCPKGPGGHFLDAGHNKVANKLYEYIGNLGWLS